MRLIRLIILISLVTFFSAPANAAGPCDTLQGFNYCNCLMYPGGSGNPPVAAFAAPLFNCFTDSTKTDGSVVIVHPAPGGYPRGLIPYITYQALKDTNLATIFKYIIYTMLSLSVAFYGMRMYYGMVENVRSETFVLIFKVAAIVYFMNKAPSLYLDMLNVVKQFTDIMVTSTAGLRGVLSNNDAMFWTKCVTNSAGALTNAAPANTSELWSIWDCTFNYLIGLVTDTPAGEAIATVFGIVGVATLLAGTFAPAAFVLIIIIYMVIGLFSLVMKFLQTFLLSLMGLSFMFIMGYIFVPLILFTHTYKSFHTWISLCISYMLTPILIMAYMCMVLAMLDVALFTGQNSVFESLVNNARNRTYASNGANSPLLDVVRKKTKDFKSLASVDNAGNQAIACGGSSSSQGGGIIQGQVDQNKTGTSSLNNQPATSGNLGLELGALYLTRCTPEPPADLANPLPPGCTRNPAAFAGLADNYDKNGVNYGGNNVWMYVRDIMTSSAMAALLVYVINAVFPYIPKLVNGLVAPEMNIQGIMNNKMIGEDSLKGLVNRGFKTAKDKNFGAGNLMQQINKSISQSGVGKPPT